MPKIVPLRTGWDPVPDGSDWYPSDLPAEWRLAYFANAFWGVLVPSELWRDVGAAGAAVWVADTRARFRFFLELDAWDAASRADSVAEALGDRLGGLVGPSPVPQVPPDSIPGEEPGAGPRLILRVDPATRLRGNAEAWGLAWEVPVPLLRDLRGARAWVDARVREQCRRGLDERGVSAPVPPLLALLGECRLEDLAQWQSMLELMGLA